MAGTLDSFFLWEKMFSNMLVLTENIKFPRGKYQTLVPRHKHSIVFIVHPKGALTNLRNTVALNSYQGLSVLSNFLGV